MSEYIIRKLKSITVTLLIVVIGFGNLLAVRAEESSSISNNPNTPNDYMEKGIRAAYDNMHLVFEAYYDDAGNLITQPGGFVAIEQEWDKDWNLISRTYLGVDGKPVNRTDGYAIEVWDENGDFEFYDKDLNVVDKELVLAKSTWSTPGTRGYIGIGDYNEDVFALHQKLADLGYYSLRPESPWSIFSVNALKVLQENLGLPMTGIVESREQLEELLAVEDVIGKNLLLGTNQGVKNYSIIQNGFETEMTSPDGIEVKVAIMSKAEDAQWLVLFFKDNQSRRELVGPAGEQYTLSFEAKSNVAGATASVSHRQTNWKGNQIDFGGFRIEEADVWQRFELTGKLTGEVEMSQGLYFALGGNLAGTEIEIRNLKLEKGSKATEWVDAE